MFVCVLLRVSDQARLAGSGQQGPMERTVGRGGLSSCERPLDSAGRSFSPLVTCLPVSCVRAPCVGPGCHSWHSGPSCLVFSCKVHFTLAVAHPEQSAHWGAAPIYCLATAPLPRAQTLPQGDPVPLGRCSALSLYLEPHHAAPACWCSLAFAALSSHILSWGEISYDI